MLIDGSDDLIGVVNPDVEKDLKVNWPEETFQRDLRRNCGMFVNW